MSEDPAQEGQAQAPADDVPLRHVDARGAEGEVPVPRPAARDKPVTVLSVLRETAHASHSGLPRPGGYARYSPPQAGGLDRVILIERCSGVQVGQDNDQYSVYRVTVPTVALESGKALAGQLLSQQTPWSADLFSHDAPQIRDSTPGGGCPSASRGVTASPDGDTLVIVRNSRGVQIGDHNVQHNQFRIRVAGITVHADQLTMTPQRQALISQLRQNPGDQAAAHTLARDVAQAARIDIIATLTDQVTGTVNPPRIDRWPAEVHDRTGVQIGAPSRASVTVDVTISAWDSTALEHQLLERAASLHKLTAMQDEPDPPAPRHPSPDPGSSLDDL